MPFNHCPDRLTNRSEEVNRELSPLKLNNKGILMTLQSSQKYVHSVVWAGETPAEEAQAQSRASCCCTHIASASSWEENKCSLHCKNSFWCWSFCLPALVPFPQLSVTALLSIPATPSTSWPKHDPRAAAANQAWVLWAAPACRSTLLL